MKNLFTLLTVLLFIACQSEHLDQENNNLDVTLQNQDSERVYKTFSNGLVLEIRDGQYTLDDDIVLTDEQVAILTESSPSQSSAITRNFVTRWPGGDVYYTISNDVPNQQRIQSAITHWETSTPIRFY